MKFKVTITLCAYIVTIIYLLNISFQSPVLGIELKREQNDWIIEGYANPKWASKNGIKQEDILLSINGEPLQLDESVQRYTVRFADSLQVKKSNGDVNSIQLVPFQFYEPFIFSFLLPLIFSVVSFVYCLYISRIQNGTSKQRRLLIYFILSVSITYSSISPAIIGNPIGIFINSNFFLISAVLLVLFLNSYLTSIVPTLKYFINRRLLVMTVVIILLLTIGEIFYNDLRSFNTVLLLTLSCMNLIYSVFIIGRAYLYSKKKQLLLIFSCFIVPISPAIFLYIVPVLLMKRAILPVTTCALFLLLIPVSLVVTQLPERMFDMHYQLSKFRNYSTFSIILTLILCGAIYFIVPMSTRQMLMLAFVIYSSVMIMFYIKEYLDFYNRKILYLPKDNMIQLIYNTIERIKQVTTEEELFQQFEKELRQHLNLQHIYIERYPMHQEAMNDSDKTALLYNTLQIGELKKRNNMYVGCLYQTLTEKYILTINFPNDAYLKKEEQMALELLMMYMSSFIDNTQMVEDILKHLENKKQNENYPFWLSKVLWLQLENEKKQLSQELHDTILQQLVHLIRNTEKMQKEKQIDNLTLQVAEHRTQLIHLNHQLRYYCEQLKPPLLEKQNLPRALTKLFKDIDRIADFYIHSNIENVSIEHPDLPLFIYRTFQELLNNAIKHSQATYINLQLHELPNGFKLEYYDNGIGFDIQKINQTEGIGLQGIKERVRAYEGMIEIESAPEEGMYVQIIIGEDGENDSLTNSR